MFASIRWKLVASYMFLALMTVSAVGVLALAVVKRSIQQQELNNLRANAQTVASQALPLILPCLARRSSSNWRRPPRSWETCACESWTRRKTCWPTRECPVE